MIYQPSKTEWLLFLALFGLFAWAAVEIAIWLASGIGTVFLKGLGVI